MTTSAQGRFGIVENINRALDEVNLTQHLHVSCNEGHRESASGEGIYNQCIEDACKEKGPFVSVLDEWQKNYLAMELLEENSLATNQIEQEIEKKIALLHSYDPYSIGAGEKEKQMVLRMAETPLEYFHLESKGLNNFIFFMEGAKIFQVFKYDEDSEIFEVSEKLYKNRPERELKRLEPFAKKLVDYLNSTDFATKNVASEKYLEQRYKEGPKKEKIIKFLDDLEISKVRFQEKLGGITPFPIDISSLRQSVESNTLTQLELDMLVNNSTTVEMYELVFEYQEKHEKEIAEDLIVRYKNWVNVNGIEKLKTKIKQSWDKSKKEELAEAEVRKKEGEFARTYCLNKFRANMNLLPEENTISKMQKVVDDAKKFFVNNINNLQGISKASAKTIIPEIQKLTFKLPFSKETYQKMMLQLLDTKIEENKQTNKNLKKNINDKALYTFASLTAIFPDEFSGNDDEEKENDDEDRNELQGDVTDLCDQLEQDAFSDATYTGLGQINLSYTLPKGPIDYQKGVIFHEIAHNLESIIRRKNISEHSQKSFDELKICLGSIHIPIVGEGKKDQYFSEDYADLVANRLLLKGVKPLMCQYMVRDSESNKFAHNSIANESEDDTHSSSLLRVLRHYANQSMDLPESCKTALLKEAQLNTQAYCKY